MVTKSGLEEHVLMRRASFDALENNFKTFSCLQMGFKGFWKQVILLVSEILFNKGYS